MEIPACGLWEDSTSKNWSVCRIALPSWSLRYFGGETVNQPFLLGVAGAGMGQAAGGQGSEMRFTTRVQPGALASVALSLESSQDQETPMSWALGTGLRGMLSGVRPLCPADPTALMG